MTEAATTTQTRIESLDVIRGLAVLGILAVNASFFALPVAANINPALPGWEITGANLTAWWTSQVFFELKFITIFSMLFGVSLYLVGGERSEKERGKLLRSRLFWLLLFGLAHGLLLWYGDILFAYALTGFLVLFARSWKALTLTIVGLVLFAISFALSVGFGSMLAYSPAEVQAEILNTVWAPPPEVVAGQISAMAGEQGIVGLLAENMRQWAEYTQYALLSGVVRTAGVMMIGLALFKWGFLSGKAPAWVYGLFAAIGAPALAVVGWQASMNAEAGFPFLHMMGPGLAANYVLSLPIAIAYMALMIALVKVGAFAWLTKPLAAVGRMAFTNYIAQTLIMTTIFHGARGLGLFGEMDRVTLWGVVVAIWAAQLIWSPLYMSRFRMGPLEWLWRRLATGRSESFEAAARA